MEGNQEKLAAHAQATIVPLYPEVVNGEDELRALEEKYLAEGFEGAMIRRMDGVYKFGRATPKSGILSKLKRFSDAEALVIGFEELTHNENAAEKNAFGRTKRGQSKEGLVGAGTLGSLMVRREEDGVEFNIGTGFSAADRDRIWKERDTLLGKNVTYRFFAQGIKVAPRFPSFVGFREDL
jgi:DNA ligase-1